MTMELRNLFVLGYRASLRAQIEARKATVIAADLLQIREEFDENEDDDEDEFCDCLKEI
jgi:hypothetical protein